MLENGLDSLSMFTDTFALLVLFILRIIDLQVRFTLDPGVEQSTLFDRFGIHSPDAVFPLQIDLMLRDSFIESLCIYNHDVGQTLSREF